MLYLLMSRWRIAALIVTSCISYPALLFGLRALQIDDIRVVLGRERLA